MSIYLHKGDLPDDVTFVNSVAIDTETRGLKFSRDKLCLVQLSGGDGDAHLVQLDYNNYNAPNLVRLLTDDSILKIFHFARFDVGVIKYYFDVWVNPVYCTKIASRLARTYTDSHSLKELCREILNHKMSKEQQSSDWASGELSKAQLEYAAADVLYLHKIKQTLDDMLERDNRTALAKKIMNFLPTRVELDLAGWPDEDIFSHNSKQ